MKTTILIATTLLLQFAATCAAGSERPRTQEPCSALLGRQMQADLRLPFAEFDQTVGKGWHALEAVGREAEAATLIGQYLNANPEAHPVLQWHHAQMLAKSGEYERAISAARQTLRPSAVDSSSEFRWNPYVLGTIAFLSNDRRSLIEGRDVLERASLLNASNVAALNRLIKCYGKTYGVAYICADGR